MTDFTWEGFINRNWSTAGNWIPGNGTPSTSADTANIFGGAATLDVNETIGALTIYHGPATLDIGSNQLTVTDAGGQAGTVTLTTGSITITGGTISATNGFSAQPNAGIFGFGTLIGTIAGAGTYQAGNGTLRIESAVLASATGLAIDMFSTSVLELDSTVASGAAITFFGAVGTLELTDISRNLLQGFNGTIQGFNAGGSATVPTDQIDLAGLATDSIIAANLNTSSDVLTVTTSGGSFTLQLSGGYAASTRVGLITDGAGTGTDLFLVSGQIYSWASAAFGNWSAAADWTPSGGPPSASTDSAVISASGSSYTVALDVNETIGALTIGNSLATLDIGNKQLTVTDAGGQAGTVTLTAGFISIAGGTLSATNGFSVTDEISGTGTLIGTIAGTGMYQASGGTLRLESAVMASATGLRIVGTSASELELDSTVASGALITFLGSAGTLDLTDVSGNLLQGFSGTIAGLAVGGSATVPTNQIDLAGLAKANISAASLNTSTDVLTVTTTGGSFTLQLGGSYAAGTFVDWITDGATTGSDLFLSSVACYCRGTLIRTPDGEVPVEQLAIGGEVVTLSGEARPIRWIGRRAYDGRFIAGNREVLPIRIAAGALADGVPGRDLWLSPEHSLYLDGALVQAKDLVNGATIVRADSVERLEYFHLELDSHDVVFADGAPAETFVDCDNRLMFSNGAEYAALYPDDDRPRWAFCLPRLEWGSAELSEIREMLLWRAEALGHELTADPDLHLVVDGAIVRPQAASARLYRFEIPAGSADIRLASRSSVPAEIVPDAGDLRRLGVPLERIALSDADTSLEIRHGHAALCGGFHEDETSHRWTDGRARLPANWPGLFSGAWFLDAHLAPSQLRYRLDPAESRRAAA